MSTFLRTHQAAHQAVVVHPVEKLRQLDIQAESQPIRHMLTALSNCLALAAIWGNPVESGQRSGQVVRQIKNIS
jgi:hypothetical protein